MDSTTLLPSLAANVSRTAMASARLGVTSEVTSSSHVNPSTSLIMNVTNMITDTLANDSYHLFSSYIPDNGSSSVNATRIPEASGEMGIKHIVVILTNVVVVAAIILTCFLALRHKRWETRMRSQMTKDSNFDYNLVDVEGNDSEELNEDEEIFEK